MNDKAELFRSVNQEDDDIGVAKLRELVDTAPIEHVVHLLLSLAIRDRATHIHLEPQQNSLRVRYRVDRVLHDVMTPPPQLHAPLVGRFKQVAGLDVATRDKMQQGSFRMRLRDKEHRMRLSICPTVRGEKVLVELCREPLPLPLTSLGLPDRSVHTLRTLLRRRGLILVSGPGCSGLSTTLRALLGAVDASSLSVTLVEQEADHFLPGVNQVCFNGCTRTLQSQIKQDVDVIGVDYAQYVDRDRCGCTRPAQILVKAAERGKLVVSTINAYDALGAVWRLLDSYLEPHLLAGSLSGVIAQRLVRAYCGNCKRHGCEQCKMTGYVGRTGLFELLLPSERLRAMIARRAPWGEMRDCLRREGFQSLWAEGQRLVSAGVTSAFELSRMAWPLTFDGPPQSRMRLT